MIKGYEVNRVFILIIGMVVGGVLAANIITDHNELIIQEELLNHHMEINNKLEKLYKPTL